MNVGGLQAEDKTTGILSHHEVLYRLEAFDTERGERRRRFSYDVGKYLHR